MARVHTGQDLDPRSDRGLFSVRDSLATLAGCEVGMARRDFFLSQREYKDPLSVVLLKVSGFEIRLAGTDHLLLGAYIWPRRY